MATRDKTERFITLQDLEDWLFDTKVFPSSFDVWRISNITVTDRYVKLYIFDDFGNYEEKILYKGS